VRGKQQVYNKKEMKWIHEQLARRLVEEQRAIELQKYMRSKKEPSKNDDTSSTGVSCSSWWPSRFLHFPSGFPTRLLSLIGVALILVPYSYAMDSDGKSKVLIGGAYACKNTSMCEEVMPKMGSICANGGFCTNPYSRGCLGFGNESYPPLRVCNSDDKQNSDCLNSAEFTYEEIGIQNGDWQNAMFLAWIYQIFLSEVLGVPARIDNGLNGNANFYDIGMLYNVSKMYYNYEGLKRANADSSCESYNTHINCSHVIPEVWSGQKDEWRKAQEDGLIDPVSSNGLLGRYSWYIPVWLAEEQSDFMSTYGLKGEEMRQTLAETFKRPTNWTYYCNKVSKNKCEFEDSVAKRAPADEDEEGKYYDRDFYTGYFRQTDRNNCTLNKSSCTGEFISESCGVTGGGSEQVMHHLNIALKGTGPLGPTGAYSNKACREIWSAANATRSPVIMSWYQPDSFLTKFEGSQSALTAVLLPTLTATCVAKKTNKEQRCSNVEETRFGQREGVCDSEYESFKKYIVASLSLDWKKKKDVEQSPAYLFIRDFQLSNLEISDIFRRLLENLDGDKSSFIGIPARKAVCSWMTENIEELKRFVPRTYPRTIKQTKKKSSLMTFALVFGSIDILCLLVTIFLIFVNRNMKVIKSAQINFLGFILAGLCLVLISSVLNVSLDGSCVLKQWFVTMGYTLVLVPLLVKVGAINKVFQQSDKLQRTTLRLNDLYKIVGIVFTILVIFLTVWTVVDAPKNMENAKLLQEVNLETGGLYVEKTYACLSEYKIWNVLFYTYQVILLLIASVIAHQNRKVSRQEFNESTYLAMIIYSNVIFLVLRGTLDFVSDPSNGVDDLITIDFDILRGLKSIIFQIDTLVTLLIYFVPKLLAAKKEMYHIPEESERSKTRRRISTCSIP